MERVSTITLRIEPHAFPVSDNSMVSMSIDDMTREAVEVEAEEFVGIDGRMPTGNRDRVEQRAIPMNIRDRHCLVECQEPAAQPEPVGSGERRLCRKAETGSGEIVQQSAGRRIVESQPTILDAEPVGCPCPIDERSEMPSCVDRQHDPDGGDRRSDGSQHPIGRNDQRGEPGDDEAVSDHAEFGCSRSNGGKLGEVVACEERFDRIGVGGGQQCHGRVIPSRCGSHEGPGR